MLNTRLIFVGCPSPPEEEFVSWKIEFSYKEDEFWSYTEVTYKCKPSHSFLWGENKMRTCGINGTWDFQNAPKCAPSKLELKILRKCS